MSIEKIGDVLRDGRGENYFKIYQAFQLQKLIEQKIREKVTVIVKLRIISIQCHTPAQMAFLKLKTAMLHELMRQVFGPNHSYQLKFKVTYS